MDDSQTLGLSSQSFQFALALKPDLDLMGHILLINKDTFLLGVTLLQTHLLDLDLPTGDFIIAKEDSKWNTVVLGGLELRRQSWLHLVHELGLYDMN